MALRELLSPDALQLGPGLRRDDAVMWRWGAGEMDSRLCGNDAGSGVSDVDSGGEVPGWAGRSGSASSGAAQASRSGINLFSQTASPLKDARSGIKIRDQLVLKVRDHVLDPQLALLEAADLQLVAGGVGGEARDDHVEVAVFDLELDQLARDFGRVLGLHAGTGAGDTASLAPRATGGARRYNPRPGAARARADPAAERSA